VPSFDQILHQLPQQLVIALNQGAIYALIAIGYTMVYGVLRLINFAHGDVYMMGGYAGLYAAGWLGVAALIKDKDVVPVSAVLLIFLVAMLASAVLGMAVERFAYRPLRGASRLAALITAIGVSMLLEYGGQGVFSPSRQAFPELIPRVFLLKSQLLTISLKQVVIIGVSGMMMVGLSFFVMKTRTGRALRAIALDRPAAALMGINTDRMISLTFALGSALAATAGILDAVDKGGIEPLMGLMVGLKAFVAAVIGGIGSISGAALGGLIMALAEMLVVLLGQSKYQDAVTFTLLIIVLVFRPGGLMGRYAPEKV
jgi:branched-chain amino acid transport system permease protein